MGVFLGLDTSLAVLGVFRGAGGWFGLYQYRKRTYALDIQAYVFNE